jgi:hypothetical protein
VRRVPGASNVYPEQVTSGQYLNSEVGRGAAARYGIGVGDIQQVIETAIGETTLTGLARWTMVPFLCASPKCLQDTGRTLEETRGLLRRTQKPVSDWNSDPCSQ